MDAFKSDPISSLAPRSLPDIVIVPINGGKQESPRPPEPPNLRHWQIEEFLRQTGKSDNTQRVYRGQLVRFAAWCDKPWLDVTPSDVGKYRRELKLKGLKATSVNHALNTLKAFYGWLRRSNGYPMNKPLPTDAIDLERQPEPEADHIDGDDLAQIWQVLEFEEKTAVRDASGTRVRDRAIVAVLSHGLRASEASNLDVEHWNGKILKVHRSKGQNVSEVPLNRDARRHLEAYLEWRRQQGEMFEPRPESPMFLAQDGLITNDKFCWIRPLHLSLSWNEAQRQQAVMLSRSRNSLEALEGTVPLEVANEATVDHQTTTPSHGRRAETMGPSLSTAATCGNSAKSKCRRKRASRSTDPCTAGEDR